MRGYPGKRPQAARGLGLARNRLLTESREAFQKGDRQNGGVLWQRGLDEMDQAAELAPNDLGVRVVRGAVLLLASQYLADEASRPLIEKGVSDYEQAYSVQGPDLSRLGAHKSARLGETDKAEQWFQRIQKDLPETAYAKSATTWLLTRKLAPRDAGCLSCHTGGSQGSK